MQETWAWYPSWEDPREKEMATHSSILAWRLSWTEEPGGLQPTGSQESGMTEWLTYYRGHMASVVLCQVFVVHSLQDGSKWSQAPGIQTFAYFPPTFYQDCDQSVVQSLNCVWLSATPCTAACQAPLSPTISQSLLTFMPTELVMLSNHLILWCRLLLLSICPNIRVFSSKLALCIRWPKYWSFSFSISPSNEHLGLTSFTMDCLDLLVVQGTLKSLLQHHNSKASILGAQPSLWFKYHIHTQQLEKIIALAMWTSVSKVMSLLFNTLSRFVITFLPRSNIIQQKW